MKTWYRAVCDEHKEACHIFVSNPSCTSHYLSVNDQNIQDWLSKHYACKLRLIHHDVDLDTIFDNNYKIIDYEWKGIKIDKVEKI